MQRRFSVAALLVAIAVLFGPTVRGAGPVTITLPAWRLVSRAEVAA